MSKTQVKHIVQVGNNRKKDKRRRKWRMKSGKRKERAAPTIKKWKEKKRKMSYITMFDFHIAFAFAFVRFHLVCLFLCLFAWVSASMCAHIATLCAWLLRLSCFCYCSSILLHIYQMVVQVNSNLRLDVFLRLLLHIRWH